MTSKELAAFVAASCERQGVAVKVKDAHVVAKIAVLLRGDRVTPQQSSRLDLRSADRDLQAVKSGQSGS